MECKIIIRSYKRADKVLATEVFETAKICVPESQEIEYKEYNPNHEIVTHPDSVIGLPAKNNWMYKKFGSVFLCDDDIHSMRRMYAEKNEEQVVPKGKTDEIVEETYQLAKCLGIYLFALSKRYANMFYDSMEPIHLSGSVTGGMYGLREGSGLSWDEHIKTGEDHYISLLNAYYHRKCLIDDRFALQQKDTFARSGGLAEYRDKTTEKETFDFLRAEFGSAVQPKNQQNQQRADKKNQFGRSLKIPF